MKRTKEDYLIAAEKSLSIAQMCRELGIKPIGGNYRVINNKIKEYNIDISHFTGKAWNQGKRYRQINKPKSLKEILVKDSYYQSYKLKYRLIKEGLKENKCEICGCIEWLNKPINLELHHINGDKFDNRLENLQLLCPNCHSYTEHYRGKNKIRYDEIKPKIEIINIEDIPKKIKKEKTEKPKRYCEVCGKELSYKQTKYCSYECANKSQTKRPEYDVLLETLKSNDYNLTKVGKIYNVSSNAVKKWCKKYGITNGSNDFIHRKH